jgi:hypothetical protein
MERSRRADLLAGVGVLAALVLLVAAFVARDLRRTSHAINSFIHDVRDSIAAQVVRIDTQTVPAGSVILVGDSVFGTVTDVWQVRRDSSRPANPVDVPAKNLFAAFGNPGPFVIILAKGRHDSTLVLDDRMVAVVDSPLDIRRPLRVRLALRGFAPSSPVAGYLMTVPWRVIPIIVRRPGA